MANICALPTEILDFIFQYCDTKSVQGLRLASSRLAYIGLEYLIQPDFTAVQHRDDVARLRAIASHSQLRNKIETLTFNLIQFQIEDVRSVSCRYVYEKKIVEWPDRLHDAWASFNEIERQRRNVLPLQSRHPHEIRDAVQMLPNLHRVAVSYTRSPYRLALLDRSIERISLQKPYDASLAARQLFVILAALQQVANPNLTHLSIDRLTPVSVSSKNRAHWLNCANLLAGLTHLNLGVDSSSLEFPSARWRFINGLGGLLRLAPNLTHLSIVFNNHKGLLQFDFEEIFPLEEVKNGDVAAAATNGNGSNAANKSHRRFRYHALTDLHIDGISCTERGLLSFLLTHASTLRRVRFGGRGTATEPDEASNGGLCLSDGNFYSLFRNMRVCMRPLQHLHLEGIFQCAHGTPITDEHRPQPPPPSEDTAVPSDRPIGYREAYHFVPITDDDWEVPSKERAGAKLERSITCQDFENYVLRVNPWYPLVRRGG